MPNGHIPRLNERQIAHRRAMLAHLTQTARRRDYNGGVSPSRSRLALVRSIHGLLTPRVAMDTITMDER
jgi:hypothetical protein